MSPACLAERLARLRWTPHDPSAFLAERSALVQELRLLPVPTSPAVIRYEQADPMTDQRVRRLQALLAARDGEVAQLKHLLATVQARPRRRRQPVDDRQRSFPFHHVGARP